MGGAVPAMGAPSFPHVLSPGTWLRVDCVDRIGIAFAHDGIVVRVAAADDDDTHMITVAHPNPKYYGGSGGPSVHTTTLATFLRMGRNPRVVDERADFPPERVVERALFRLAAPPSWRTRPFAHWCCRRSFSAQLVLYAAAGAAGAAAGLAAALAMAMAAAWVALRRAPA